ncbi:50S ribosomal protein L11 methyltransferase [Desulfonema magnum]|uniref:50S ribosomal protein L11 methyltransferase n=1 Tax=Desulfonema magnum TaxID=45655 RepID=A0A975GRL2_9BACT|nr:50S ribosomal protein L11 methyltransferase [Desulfonema magnum]QTA91032.1 Uncharacterized protein dnm_070970 [Desulfonema magnum]
MYFHGKERTLTMTLANVKNVKTIRKNVLKTVLESKKRLTPIALENKISQKFALKRKQTKSVIRDLVAQQELTYTYQYGCTFLEQSFNKPVRVSTYVVLKPPESDYPPKSGDVVVEIRPGASFGTGQHPTTRLAIRGIEYALTRSDFIKHQETCLFDIGTGSGVLAIAAVRFGITKGIGTDTDPCSISEAKENVKINGLEDQIIICDEPAENIRKSFSLIIANLRYPTLKQLSLHISELTGKNGFVILSGIKADELADLLNVYRIRHFECQWKETEKDWAGVVLKK